MLSKKKIDKASTTSLVQLTTEPPANKPNKFASLLWKWIMKIISCCYSHKKKKKNSFQWPVVCMNSQDRDTSSLYMLWANGNELPLGKLLQTPAVNEIYAFSGADKDLEQGNHGSRGSGKDDLEVLFPPCSHDHAARNFVAGSIRFQNQSSLHPSKISGRLSQVPKFSQVSYVLKWCIPFI